MQIFDKDISILSTNYEKTNLDMKNTFQEYLSKQIVVTRLITALPAIRFNRNVSRLPTLSCYAKKSIISLMESSYYYESIIDHRIKTRPSYYTSQLSLDLSFDELSAILFANDDSVISKTVPEIVQNKLTRELYYVKDYNKLTQKPFIEPIFDAHYNYSYNAYWDMVGPISD